MKMLVIADDLTGAAEIAALGHRYGLVTRLVRGAISEQSADGLTVLDTDSRLLDSPQAACRLRALFQSLRERGITFDFVFKKIDSVLRGPVLAEVEAAVEMMGWTSALLVPANPSRGRRISRGIYSIDGKPLHLTTFGHDPEYPCRTSSVIELLGTEGRLKLASASCTEDVPLDGGIVVGDVMTVDDVKRWSQRLKPKMLPVGGADFCQAFLQGMGLKPLQHRPTHSEHYGQSVLIVCGSASEMSREAVSRAQQEGFNIAPMPDDVFMENTVDSPSLKTWSVQIADMLRSSQHAILAITHPVKPDVGRAKLLTSKVAEAVARVLSTVYVGRMALEGGATAESVVGRMGWNEFVLLGEMVPGVVQLRTRGQNGMQLVLKPGSYPWPVSWSDMLGMSREERLVEVAT